MGLRAVRTAAIDEHVTVDAGARAIGFSSATLSPVTNRREAYWIKEAAMKYAMLMFLSFAVAAVAAPISDDESAGISELNLEALEMAFDLDNARVDQWDAAHPCGDIKLTDAQKASLKAAFVGYKKAQIQSQANLKIARIDYIMSLSDTKGTKTTAETAATAFGGAKAKISANHLGFANEILFDILTADQRKPALVCMHHFHKHMKAMKLKKLCAHKPHQHPHPKPHPKPDKPDVKPVQPQPEPTPKP